MGTDVAGEVFGRYRLLETLPWGGIGTVYRAYDTTMTREVAIRVLPTESTDEPGQQEKLRDDVTIAARLSNPNIMPIYEIGDVDGRLYLAMPLLDGTDAQSLLHRDGRMSPRSAVRLVEQAAVAVDAAHNSGLVHGDLKLSNLFVTPGELVFLLNFGVSAAPAEASGDIQALAGVLYECLTGQPAVTVPPKPTDIDPTIPTGFDDVIARGMAAEPDERFHTARELAVAARDALASPVAAAASPPVEVEFGRYRLFELLGQGSMGSVYRAHDTGLDRDVAVKVLRPELASEPGYKERFRREAFAAGRLASPNIIPIYDAGEIDGRLYLVMPIIDGIDMSTVLRRDGHMSPQKAVRVVEQVAAALDAAHKAGLVHRDVKPSNLLMVGDEFVYLIDFGLVQETMGTRLTRTNLNPGTPAYMAPERFKLETIADARGDVYSLACVLYECLTGQVPYAGGGVEGLAAAHLFSEAPKPSSVDAGLPISFDAVIERGMAKEIDERYQTANDLAVAARAALSSDSVEAVTPLPATDPMHSVQAAEATAIASPAAEPSPRNRRRSLAIAGAVVVVVAASVAAYLGPLHQFRTQEARAEVVLPFTGLNGPAGVAIDKKGDIYVVDSGNNRVLELAAGSGSQTVVPIPGLDRPDDMAVDDAGDMVVTEPGRHRVVALTAGSTTPTVLPFTDLGEPTGVAFSSKGARADRAVFVTDATHNRVLQLLTQSTEQTVLPFSGLSGPSAIAVGGDRALFVIDRENERVLKLPRTATADTVLPYVIGRPDWVAVDADGNVYVTDSHGNRVLKLVKESSTAITLPFKGLSNPQGIALDAAGNIYVADAGNNRILKLPQQS